MKPHIRIALGFSPSSYELLKRLKFRGHADLISLPPGSISELELSEKDILFDKPRKIFENFWSSRTTFLVIGSIGAAIRIIAPFLKGKDIDPSVLVIDGEAENIVPILGGHKGGAEEFAIQLAQDIGGKAIFTGFSRTNKILSVDSFGETWGWKRTGKKSDWNDLMISLSKGRQILVNQTAGSKLWNRSKGARQACHFSEIATISPFPPSLHICSEKLEKCCWHPPTLWLGIGCERNTTLNLIERAVRESLKESGLAKEAFAGLATIDIKSNEVAIKDFQRNESLFIRFYKAKELLNVSVPNPSARVRDEIGTSSVAEAAAILASGEKGKLKYEKHIYRAQNNEKGAVTIAIAESRKPFSPLKGQIHLIGSGPGEPSFLTHDARFALSRSAIWIGYTRYLDLLEPIRRFDQVRLESSLTNERQRCKEALELASQGISVALISSGDSGIYGMAGLTLELWLKTTKSERPNFKVHPGISAFQMAGAKIGAPLMHDFCAISLSDCLTSWTKIEKRIKAASVSDFVIAFYNPRSKDRNWQLQKAIDLILENRAASTPVVLARQLCRKEEKVEVYSLGDVPIDQIDMLTLILVGNSTSFCQDGYVVTPRGY